MSIALKTVFSVFFLGLFFSGFTQEAAEDAYSEEDAKIIHWGFSVGLESGLFFGKENPTDTSRSRFTDAKAIPGFGVSAGLGVSIRLADKFSLKTGATLSILPTRVRYGRMNTSPENPLIFPFTAEVPVHFLFGNPLETKKGSVFVGPTLEFNIPAIETGRFSNESFFLRGDVGFTVPVNIGMGEALLDIVYGISVTPLLQGNSVYDQWWDSSGRHRFALRLNLY